MTVNTLPVATFSYSATPYCQNSSNPSPTFSGGGIAGIFTSSAGLTFVSNLTGQVNLTNSIPGTYTVTNTINASGGCSQVIATSTIMINPITSLVSQSTTGQSQCQGGTFAPISVISNGVGLNYQWYSNTLANNFGGTSLNSANGAQTNTYTPQASASGTLYYYCVITGTCGIVTSAVSGAFVVNQIPVITTTNPGSQCGPGSLTISATASIGTIYWYAASTGGTSLATGPTFTTPVLSATTTYYVEAFNNGCPSATRTPVVATIIPVASLTAGGGGTYCSGSTINLTSSGTNVSNQYWQGPNNFYSTDANPVISSATSAMSGTYTITASSVSGVNLIYNGDFEAGNVSFGSGYTVGTDLVPEGRYAVIANPNTVHSNFSTCSDHSSSGTLQMVVNGATVAGVNVWSQTVNVVQNSDYQFTYWIQSVVNGNPSQLQLYVNGVPAGPVYTAITATCQWAQFLYNWNSGSSTTAYLSLVNQNIVAGGNDFALDDIIFQQVCTVASGGGGGGGGGGGFVSPSASVAVVVNTAVTAGSIGSNQSICRGYTPALLTSASAGTGSGTISYEWQTNASGIYTTIIGATSATYSPPALSATTGYQRRTVSVSNGVTCYSANTTPVIITVSGPTVSAGGPNTVCQSGSPSAITLIGATYGGGATSAAWSILSGGGTLSSTSQTINPSAVTYTPAANFTGIAILRLTTSGGTCAAISDRIINVNPNSVITLTSVVGTNSQTVCINNSISNITYSVSGGGTGAGVTGLPTGVSGTYSAGVFTINGTPSISGIYNYTVTTTGTCTQTTATGTLTVTPNNTISLSSASGTDNQTKCINTAITNITYSTVQATGATITGLPAGVTGNWASNTVTISGTPTVSGSFNYSISLSGGCGTISTTGTIIVTPLPSATISYPNSPYCKSLITAQSVTRIGTAGGTYSSLPAGLTLDVNSGAIIPNTSSAGTYTVTYTVAASGGCSIYSTNTSVTIVSDLIWTGTVSTDWNVAGNWSCNVIPDLTTNVLIPNVANQPILSNGAVGKSKNMVINAVSALTVTGNTLQIAGTISNSGVFTASAGTIEMKGSANQIIPANCFAGNTIMNLNIDNNSGVILQGTLNISGIVDAINGNLSTGGFLTLISTSTQTALIDGSGSGEILGNVTMQRYLPSAFGYKYFSSPFSDATVAQFADDINLAAPFPTLYKYDENHLSPTGTDVSGWVAYTTQTGLLNPLEGYAANFGPVETIKTVDITGIVNNGPIQRNLINHNRFFTKGFHLIGNPYPSPINWDNAGWTKTNVDNSIYFFSASSPDASSAVNDSIQYRGTYSSYVGGVSTGINNNNIAAMQGFFVHVANGAYPVSASLGVTNAVRTNNLNPIFKETIFDNRVILRFSASFDIKNSRSDVAVIYFDDRAKQSFDTNKDALKIINTDEQVPNLFSLSTDFRQLSINGMDTPSDSLTKIPLCLKTLSDGWINFNANDISQLPSNMFIYLVDSEQKVTKDLKLNPKHRFFLKAGEYNNRFTLVFSYSKQLEAQAVDNNIFTVSMSSNHLVVKIGLPLNASGNLLVTNMKGQVLLQKEVSGKETVELNPHLNTGVYIITLISGVKKESKKILMRRDYE
jgi:hypothetical protein